ncbi:filamentation induced by cAMP protein Fic [Thalassoporum mexicanum PCC 7367]|uniref:Fic family protein n=1 Tax=Thalassoporum mexicanum TaxID=3457544 RepID=UPI00029FFA66|nr:Fic family protein [Pseudanabaena sp. PCC 7367]AFY69725.1 filamentation induced by cAMP protein Fic [Pseudanabaena sp. PCC 7367]
MVDKSLFKSNKLGFLREVTIHGINDWAFIPAPLPQTWKIPTDILPLLIEAHRELGRLDGVGRHLPSFDLLLKPLQKREALRSSSLEGTYATPEQLLLFELDPREPKSVQDSVNAWKEVANYSAALSLGINLLNEVGISLRLIRELHNTLLDGVRGANRDPGNFRRTQVHIGSASYRRFIPPPPNELMNCLYDLEKSANQGISIDPLIFCFMVHYQFETIHPFLDGNGRVGRLLMSLMIYEYCKLQQPWLYLSAYFDKYKDDYTNNLFKVSTTGDFHDWIVYCLKGTIEQSKDAILRSDRLVALREQYRELLSQTGVPFRLNAIIDQLFKSPVITIPKMAELSDVAYTTAKRDLERLIQAGIVIDSDIQSRSKIYFAPEIIEIVFGEIDTISDS